MFHWPPPFVPLVLGITVGHAHGPACCSGDKETSSGESAAASRPAAPRRAPASAPAGTAAGEPDDLTRIEGIGPKIAGLLRVAGITTFAELGKTPVEKLQAVLDGAGSRYRIHDPGTWSQQAKLAAAGRTEDFAKLKSELKGGRLRG